MGLWGGRWGSTRWGSTSNFDHSNSQGAEPNAKQDTVGLYKSSDGTFSELVTDRSGEGNSLTDSSTYMETTTSSEVEALTWTGEGCFECVVDVPSSLTEETIFSASKSGTGTVEMRLSLEDDGGGIEAKIYVNSTSEDLSVNVDGLAGKKAAFCWSTRANPDTTGSSDAYESYLYAAGLDGVEYFQGRVTHEEITGSLDTLYVGATIARSAENVFSENIYQVRFSDHYHTSVEFYEDWVALSSYPSITLSSRVEALVPTNDTGIADDGHFAGPVYSVVGQAVRQHSLRMVGPLINELYHEPKTYDDTYVDQWAKPLNGNNNLTIVASYVAWRPVPPNVNRAKARVFIQAWDTGSGAVDIDVAAVVFNRIPNIGSITSGHANTQYTEFYDTVNVDTDHGDPTTSPLPGEWLEFEALQIPRDGIGGFYVALAFKIANTNNRFRIHAWSVEPVLWNTPGQGPIDDLTLAP